MVRDLGSRNGTWLGPTRLTPGVDAAIRVGDELRFGDDAQRWRVLDLGRPGTIDPAPMRIAPTREVSAGHRISDVRIAVHHSANHEFFQIRLGRCLDTTLPERAFHDLIWLLAQARVDQRDLAPAEAGWLYFDDLCTMLGRSRQRVNVEIFRARQQFTEAGIANGSGTIERRISTRQIRLGFADAHIAPL